MVKKSNQGFSLIEYIVAVIIISISAVSIMLGVVSIRKTSNLIAIKDSAFQELTNYTEYWKAKIAAGEWKGNNHTWNQDPPVIELLTGQDDGPNAWLYKKAGVINKTGDGRDYPYPLYSLETRIEWKDREDEPEIPKRRLQFKVYQIEFK